MRGTCESCTHFLPMSDDDLAKVGAARVAGQPAPGLCRRYPPVPMAFHVQAPPSVRAPQGGMQTVVQGQFPPVTGGNACGEYWTNGVPPLN